MSYWWCPKCKWTTEQPDHVDAVGHVCGKKSENLKRLHAPRVNVRAAIVEEANSRFPKEACGLILTTGTVIMAKNIAHDATNNFLVEPDLVEMWWPTGAVSGVWHSHCFDPAVPSEADEQKAVPGLDCWIYSVMDEQLGIYRPDRQGRLQLISMEDLA